MWRPGRCLGLEEDRAVIHPQPGAPFTDLRTRAPAKAVRVVEERVDPDLVLVRRGARREEKVEIGERGLAQTGVAGLRRLVEHVDGLSWTVDARRAEPPSGTLPELADGPLFADDHASTAGSSRPGERRTAGAGRHDVRADVAQRLELVTGFRGDEPAQPSPRDVLEVHALDRLFSAEGEDVVDARLEDPRSLRHRYESMARVPIHLRAEPGDYAEACLLPGDPLRAKHIAETFFSEPREVNGERGMLGFTGTFNGRPVSVQASGMGCPSAAIVIEELAMLGVKRIVRVGTCGGLQPDMKLGELIVAISAVASDSTATHLVREPHTPTADWGLVHEAVHAAKELGKPVRVGPIVSTDLFYNPDDGQYERWSERGILAVEMEAAVLFTLGALKGVQAGCLLTVSDVVVEGEFIRISDDEMRAAVDQMTELALTTVTAAH
jgi:purine-nucleoside phosphorylase